MIQLWLTVANFFMENKSVPATDSEVSDEKDIDEREGEEEERERERKRERESQSIKRAGKKEK